MLSKQEQAAAAYLSDDQVLIIKDFINKNKNSFPLTAKQIYAKLSNHFSNVKESTFCNSLSCNVRSRRITGIEGRKRVGYILTADKSQKEETVDECIAPPPTVVPESINTESADSKDTSPKPIIQPKKQITFARHVWIENRLYRVNKTYSDLEKIVGVVFGGKRSDNGPIVFNGEHWVCDSVSTFERLINHTLFGKFEKECEPVLNDGSGIPVELRMVS